MSDLTTIPAWAGSVSHETGQRLGQYVALLKKWNATINLIGKTTEADIWQRHIWDSYQLIPLIPSTTRSLVDLGSGAGLPGIVLACVFSFPITLVERDARKSSFLREAVRSLGLTHVTILQEDATKITGPFDVITSRALAALDTLCGFAYPLMQDGSICLFPKGENCATEVVQARTHWAFESQVIHSKTHEKASIVSISKLKPLG